MHYIPETIEAYQVTLRPVTEADLPQLRAWRNSETVSRQMLSTATISAEQQLAWYKKIARDPSQSHWVVEYKGMPIGSTNVKARHVGEQTHLAAELEPGLYIGEPAYQGNLLAFAPTLALYDHCFANWQTTVFSAVVKATNTAALKYNQQLGYEIVEQGDLITLHLDKAAYERQTVMIKRMLSRPVTRR